MYVCESTMRFLVSHVSHASTCISTYAYARWRRDHMTTRSVAHLSSQEADEAGATLGAALAPLLPVPSTDARHDLNPSASAGDGCACIPSHRFNRGRCRFAQQNAWLLVRSAAHYTMRPGSEMLSHCNVGVLLQLHGKSCRANTSAVRC